MKTRQIKLNQAILMKMGAGGSSLAWKFIKWGREEVALLGKK